MAEKYKSQVTNKWIGSGYKGTVRHLDARNTEMGQIVSALRTDLTPAMNKWGEKHIEKKKTEAGAKMDELYANGWTTKEIQKAILNDEIPELSNQYATSVVDTHSGRFEAAETIRNIEANIDDYDYKNGNQTLEEWYKQYLPDFNEASSQFTVGFSAVFNEWSAKAKIKDAENRATHAHKVKIDKGIQFQDLLTIEDIQNGKYFKQLMTLNTEMPISRKDGKAYYFDTTELNQEVALGHVKWLIDTATNTNQLDKALLILTTDRGTGKGGTKLGSLANTYSKEARELILALNNKRRVVESDDRQEKADKEKEDVSNLFAELLSDKTEVEAGTGKEITRKRTHAEQLEILKKLSAYGNPTYVTAWEKMSKFQNWKDTDPTVYNNLISDISKDKFQTMTDLLDHMIELQINPEDWKGALVYYNTFTDDLKKNKLPIFQTNQTYKDYIKMNLNAVKGNYMEKVGNIFVEKPNSYLAQANAEAYMNVEILAFEKRFREENNGKAPTFADRSKFMNQLRTLLVESFTTDNVSPKLEEFTIYEEGIKEQIALEEKKQETYSAVGVNEAVESALQVIEDNSAQFKPILEKVKETFDPSFAGIPFTGKDSRFGESDQESLMRMTTEKLPQFLADSGIFNNIFNADIIKTIETKDFNKLKNDMAKNLTTYTGWTITPDMVDQMIQLTLNK